MGISWGKKIRGRGDGKRRSRVRWGVWAFYGKTRVGGSGYLNSEYMSGSIRIGKDGKTESDRLFFRP